MIFHESYYKNVSLPCADIAYFASGRLGDIRGTVIRVVPVYNAGVQQQATVIALSVTETDDRLVE